MQERQRAKAVKFEGYRNKQLKRAAHRELRCVAIWCHVTAAGDAQPAAGARAESTPGQGLRFDI